MSKDFKSFSNYQSNQNSGNGQNRKSTQQNYEDLINQYKSMNSEDLTKTLFKEAQKLKNEGKLDTETLNNLNTTLTPYLNEDQKNILKSLISMINES